MNTMKQMHDEMLSKCFKKNGWPKPFFHFAGVIELAKDQDHYDRLLKQEFKALLICPLVAAVLFGVVVIILLFRGIL